MDIPVHKLSPGEDSVCGFELGGSRCKSALEFKKQYLSLHTEVERTIMHLVRTDKTIWTYQ